MNVKKLVIGVAKDIYLKDVVIFIDNINMIQFGAKEFGLYHDTYESYLGTCESPKIWGMIDDEDNLYCDFRDLMVGNEDFIKVKYKEVEYYINKSNLKSYEYIDGYGYDLQFTYDYWLGLECDEKILDNVIFNYKEKLNDI